MKTKTVTLLFALIAFDENIVFKAVHRIVHRVFIVLAFVRPLDLMVEWDCERVE